MSHILLHAEFSALDYSLNIVSKYCFFLSIETFAGSEPVLENFSWGFWKVLEKTWIFFANLLNILKECVECQMCG